MPAYHSGAVTGDQRDVRESLDVLHNVGRPRTPRSNTRGGLSPSESGLTAERRGNRGLLAGDVSVYGAEDCDRQAIDRFGSPLGEQRIQCGLERARRWGVQIKPLGVNGFGGKLQPVEDEVGIEVQQRPILVAGGFAFASVRHDDLRTSCRRHRRPLSGGGKPGTPATREVAPHRG